MHDLEERLQQCFLTAFPELRAGDVEGATLGGVAGWDSLGMLTLIALVEEEFSLQISTDDLTRFLSYSSILDYLVQWAASPCS